MNLFLEEAYDRNAECCLRLADQHQLVVNPAYAVALLQPQWDYRTKDRDVIWFFAYQGAIWNERKLSVFGAVDENGEPLFQYPRTDGDALAFLESQYDGFQWVALDSPEISLIAALIEPTAENGAVLDFFLVKSAPAEPAWYWRFSDRRSPEEPVRGAEMCAFVDVNGDGYRDLASLALEADSEGTLSRPHGETHPYSVDTGRFEKVPRPASSEQVAKLLTLYEKKNEAEAGAEPVFWRPSALAVPASEGSLNDDAASEDDMESEE